MTSVLPAPFELKPHAYSKGVGETLAISRARTEVALHECEQSLAMDDMAVIQQFTAVKALVAEAAKLHEADEINPANSEQSTKSHTVTCLQA